MQPILEISFGKEQISLSEQQPEIFSMPKLGYNDRCLWLMVWGGEREKEQEKGHGHQSCNISSNEAKKSNLKQI
jgi:hypothetical protein